ncbi:MAG TPA: alpha/beta fold hydrolase [Longimicrobiales bacterium]|nr:alpha/beta fold hydrolase [Longimicrobiales bacterium]
MTKTARGSSLHYRSGGPATGNPLLLIHGFPLSSAMWRPQIDAPPTGWRVIAPDLRGFGNSPATAGPVSMDSMADDLAALLAELDISSVAVCGLSMGGYVAFALLRRHPALVRALVLCDTKADADTEDVRRGRLQSASRVEAEGTGSVVDAMLPKLLSPATPRRQAALQEEVRGILESASQAGVAAALKAMAVRPDSTPMLRSINVPTQIIVGADDQITPAGGAQLMVRGIPGARIEVIPEAGHLPNLENTAAFDRALAGFLAGVS